MDKRGDNVKLKHYHLFLFATVCFFIVYIGINNKYDRFYRVPGMNNENRILVENYLDDASQNYLIENNIAMDEIVRYITYPDFKIQNYEYYPIVESSNSYSSVQEIVTQTNAIVDKLSADASWLVMDRLTTLVNSKLLVDYANNDNFNFDHISIYQQLKENYASDDSYLDLVEGYIEDLETLGYASFDECSEVLVTLFNSYTPEQVDRLINASIEQNKIVYVEDPTEITTVLNDALTIDSYVPDDLVLMEDLPRNSYFLYLRKEAYEALQEMCNAYESTEAPDAYYILSGYESYESIEALEPEKAGYKEEQLGLSVSFRVMGLSLEDFVNSNFSQWLQDHAYEYGFILRYPEGKEDVTHRDPERYTYRYVGKDVATTMHNEGIETLEEYLSMNTKESEDEK